MDKLENTGSKNETWIIYNCHAHCFSLDHVPDYFLRGYFPIKLKLSWIKKVGLLRWIINNSRKLKNKRFFRRLFGESSLEAFERIGNLLGYGDKPQEKIIRDVQRFYPSGTRFVMLTMDMDYIDAGEANVKYPLQLDELVQLKKRENLKNIIFPFAFADPRRFAEDPGHLEKVGRYVDEKLVTGIKLYPALGYWPFDKNLKMVYDLALKHNLPIVTHCIRGVVHYRGKEKPVTHPFKPDIILEGKKPKVFTTHYTHPINYECLLNKDLISKFWAIPESEASRYSNLKICLAHFGGSSEWEKYLTDPWLADSDNLKEDFSSLDKKNWHFDLVQKPMTYTWFKIICDLIEKYPNVYTDISYMLWDPIVWPLLKVLLENNPKIRRRVLFGTDYYVVSKEGSERELSIQLRGYIGEDNFKQIAFYNAEEFLNL